MTIAADVSRLSERTVGIALRLTSFVIAASVFVVLRIGAPTMWLQDRQAGPWSSSVFRERASFVLIPVPKPARARRLFAGTLAR